MSPKLKEKNRKESRQDVGGTKGKGKSDSRSLPAKSSGTQTAHVDAKKLPTKKSGCKKRTSGAWWGAEKAGCQQGQMAFRSRASAGISTKLTTVFSAELRQGRSDRDSSPCSTRPRSLSRTSPLSPRTHRLPRGRAARSSNRRSGRHGWRSTSACLSCGRAPRRRLPSHCHWTAAIACSCRAN